jgi:hypothetical protein
VGSWQIGLMPIPALFLPIDFGPQLPLTWGRSFLGHRSSGKVLAIHSPYCPGPALIAASPDHFGARNETPASF